MAWLGASGSISIGAAGDDPDARVRAELGGPDDPLDVERLFLELVVGDLVDVDLADALEDLLEEPGAVVLYLGGDGDRVQDQLLGHRAKDVQQTGDAGREGQVDDVGVAGERISGVDDQKLIGMPQLGKQ